MQVTKRDVRHAAWGIVFLLLATFFVFKALCGVERAPSIHLGAVPDATQVMLEWSIRDGEKSLNPSGYTWEYRRFPLRSTADSCSPTLPPVSEPPNPPWQRISPVVTETTLRFTDTGLDEGRVYSFCVRGTAGEESPWLYSPDPVVAVPSVSAARVLAIEQRLEPLEAGLILPCAGGNGRLLGVLRFDAGSSVLPPSDAGLSAHNATQWITIHNKLADGSGGRVVLAGYASTSYPASYNLDLSERRVETVLAKLREAVGDQWRLLTIAVGEEHGRVRSRPEVQTERRVEVHWCKERS